MPRQSLLKRSPLPSGQSMRAHHADAVVPRHVGGPRFERMSSRQELIADASQRIEIVPRIRETALQLFATGVSGGPGRGSIIGMLRVRVHCLEPMGGAEIQDAQLALARHEDIA